MEQPTAAMPPTTPTGPTVVYCPRCGIALRLQRRPVDDTPIKCYSCQARFCLDAIETAPVETTLPLPAPSSLMATAPLPGSKIATAGPSLPPLTLPPTPPAVAPTFRYAAPVGSAAPAAPKAPPAVPPPAAAPKSSPSVVLPPAATLPQAPVVPLPQASTATLPQTPVVPLPHAPPNAAPGLPTPVVPGEKKAKLVMEMGPFESLIGITLTLALIAGGIIGGVYAYRSLVGPSKAESSAPEPPIAKESNLGDEPINVGRALKTLPRLPAPPSDLEKKMEALVGRWVSRADDGSVSMIEFHKDGTAMTVSAAAPREDQVTTRGTWALVDQRDNIATVEMLYTATGLEVHRLSIEISTPDCFTVSRVTFGGRVNYSDQRFVRESATP